jgi:hypothetical protein
MREPIMKSKKQNENANQPVLQTKCLINTEGHIWMEGYFDTLPLAVRQRLRGSPFNLCPACLQTEVLPKMKRKYPTREKALFAAIEVMEAEVRKEKSR